MIRKSQERVQEKRENMRGGTGTITFNHYFKADELKARIRLCSEIVIPPGASIGLHRHDDEDEVYIVTAGAGMLAEAGGETRIGPGDAVLTGSGAEHAVRNDGANNLCMTAVIILYG